MGKRMSIVSDQNRPPKQDESGSGEARRYYNIIGFGSAYLEAGTLWLALVLDSEVRRGQLPEYSHVESSRAEMG
jgi:hypothetical protein